MWRSWSSTHRLGAVDRAGVDQTVDDRALGPLDVDLQDLHRPREREHELGEVDRLDLDEAFLVHVSLEGQDAGAGGCSDGIVCRIDVEVEADRAGVVEHRLRMELDVRHIGEPLGEDRKRGGIRLERMDERAAGRERRRHVADVGAAVDRDVPGCHTEHGDTAVEL